MGPAKLLLFLALALLGLFFLATWVRALRAGRRRHAGGGGPGWWDVGVGAVTNFFDTLGIGSFAPTTSAFKLRGTVPDELIPGTLNVGHTLPVMAQAFIFIVAIDVGAGTLVSVIAAAVAGAWLGAGIVAGMPRRRVQVGMAMLRSARREGAMASGA